MTIRFPASLGTDMKRFLLLLLLLSVVLVSCKDEKALASFSMADDGYSCTNAETGVQYTAMDFCFEPAKTAEEIGAYTDKDADYTLTYYAIPDLDTALYIADSERGVWYAAGAVTPPAAKDLTPTALLVCEEAAVSVEIFRLTAENDGEALTELLSLWFEGERAERPVGAVEFSRRIKVVSAELPNIYYCFDFGTWGDEAYFYDVFSGRTVAVPATLAERFINT